MVLALLRQAAEAASGPDGFFPGTPPWLVVLVGAVMAVLALWIFAKLLKWTIWIVIIVVLVGGVITAVKMYLEPPARSVQTPSTPVPKKLP